MKRIVGVLGLLVLAGCATTQSGGNLNQLQVKVMDLEKQVEQNSEDIRALEMDIQDVSGQVSQIQAPPSRPTIPSVVSTETKPAPTVPGGASDDTIIRVPVAPTLVQTALKNAGYYSGAIDGRIGSGTKKAIIDFQAAHQLKPDGIIGANTWTALKAYLEQ